MQPKPLKKHPKHPNKPECTKIRHNNSGKCLKFINIDKLKRPGKLTEPDN